MDKIILDNQREINKLTKVLGVLPVYLLHNQEQSSGKYALLNGNYNNFCIDYKNEFSPEEYRSYAWSSNMNNFISIDGNKLYLHSINRKQPEEIPYNIVVDNLPKFYDYLGSKKANSEITIIPFILHIYRKLRNALREAISGGDALKAFLYLISMIEDENVDLKYWGLPRGTKDVVNSINNYLWEELVTELRAGLNNDKLIPNVDLILRHTAGRLFEEANYIAQMPLQYELFPNDIIKYDYNPKLVGAYFTPSYISRTIVEESFSNFDINSTHITIFDPACGAGEFLVEALRQLKYKGYKGQIEVIGWDIAQTALDMANYVLTFEKREWCTQLTVSLYKRNSLQTEWPNNLDFIFMNPPYISWEQMDEETRELACRILGGNKGRPNLAAVFYYLAAHKLSHKGTLGCLMPSSMLNSISHMEIRNATKKTLKPLLIGRLGNYVFENAFVDACVIIASKSDDSRQTQILWIQNVDEATSKALRELRKLHYNTEIVATSENFSIYTMNQDSIIDKDSWMPMPYDAIKFKMILESKIENGSFAKVGTLFNVMQGARTGLNKVFIVDKQTYNSFSNKEKKYFRPSIDSTSLRKGKLIKANYIFFPYLENEKEKLNNEDDLKNILPNYYVRYLKPNKKQLCDRKGIDSNKWWMLTRPRMWQMQACPKLVSTEFGKSGNFSFDKTGEYIVERGCAWFFKNAETVLDEYYAYLAIFNSKIMDYLLLIYSRQLAGGAWYSLDEKNVEKIPLPILCKIDNELYLTLVEFGLRIVNLEPFNQDELDKVVSSIYEYE